MFAHQLESLDDSSLVPSDFDLASMAVAVELTIGLPLWPWLPFNSCGMNTRTFPDEDTLAARGAAQSVLQDVLWTDCLCA